MTNDQWRVTNDKCRIIGHSPLAIRHVKLVTKRLITRVFCVHKALINLELQDIFEPRKCASAKQSNERY
jgi:hypothetical protein